jgi:hypothetical protein
MHAATASDDGGGVDDVVPERKVTAFALHVAVLEKAASHVGAVCFVWATVVILGGFAADLDARDFWLVTAILLVEGTRVFSRSNELDLQEQPMHLPDAAAAAAGDDDDDPPPPPPPPRRRRPRGRRRPRPSTSCPSAAGSSRRGT